jgi:hypothetical protein
MSDFDFGNDFLNVLDDDPFEEYPVGVVEFVTSEDFILGSQVFQKFNTLL